MPNWCSNKLTVIGQKQDVLSFKAKAVGHSPWPQVQEEESPLNFHSLVPIPADIIQAGYEQAGYKWEVEHWGCKWGACDTRLVDACEDQLIYEFNTAWSPPLEWLKKVGQLWPALTFILEYEEPMMGYKGLTKAQGEVFEDHCVSL